jgi:hypothetical protein
VAAVVARRVATPRRREVVGRFEHHADGDYPFSLLQWRRTSLIADDEQATGAIATT